MVLEVLATAVTSLLPSGYLTQIVVVIVAILVVRAFSQGRVTNRERDLHARVILVTGGFSSMGITILQQLAERGAHIIALTADPIDSPKVSLLVEVLRSTTSNEQIYAEQCDLTSPSSIHSFCTRFLTGKEQRLDALLFTHEYEHIGPLKIFSATSSDVTKERESRSLATFLITTLLLPTLLVAPVERDIRIINVVNRFYAAAVADPTPIYSFPTTSSSPNKSIFLSEGIRSLRTSVFTRHLQRILDSLPAAQVPKTTDGTSTVPIVNPKDQKSNIVAVTVSPGISRVDTVASLFHADWTLTGTSSPLGVFFYLLLQPFLRILTKTPFAAMQSVLHVLFLPTPFKVLSQVTPPEKDKAKGTPIDASVTDMPEEVLKPGALYAECAVVKLKMPRPSPPPEAEIPVEDKGKEKAAAGSEEEGGLELPEDDELGGEVAGRLVWEAYEGALKAWEKTDPVVEPPKAESGGTEPAKAPETVERSE